MLPAIDKWEKISHIKTQIHNLNLSIKKNQNIASKGRWKRRLREPCEAELQRERETARHCRLMAYLSGTLHDVTHGVTSLMFINFSWKIANGMLTTNLISLRSTAPGPVSLASAACKNWDEKSGAERTGELIRSALIFSKLIWHDSVHLNGTFGLRRLVKGEQENVHKKSCYTQPCPRIDATHGM